MMKINWQFTKQKRHGSELPRLSDLPRIQEILSLNKQNPNQSTDNQKKIKRKNTLLDSALFKSHDRQKINKNKVFAMPKKFKKTNNIVENNITILNKTSHLSTPKVMKTCSSSFCQNSFNEYIIATNYTSAFSSKRGQLCSSFISQEKHKSPQKFLQPRTLLQIKKKYDNVYKEKQQSYSKQVKNNPVLQQPLISVLNRETNISRFNLYELKSYYDSLIKFSKGNIEQFKYAFQIMLNLSDITVRENIMKDCLAQLTQSQLNFTKFLKIFTQIKERLRKETIVDYFEILLEDLDKYNISYRSLLKTLEGRMKKSTANQMAELILERLDKDETNSIDKKQIYTLCYTDEIFCNKFYLINSENLKGNNGFSKVRRSNKVQLIR